MLSYLKTATHVSAATTLIGQQTWTWRQDPPPAEKFHLPEGSGDIYYLLSKLFEMNDDEKSQKDSLILALEYKDTLTFDKFALECELKEIENKK